jgi:hypothetical protein
MERSNFALRLLPSLYRAAERIAAREKCSVNQLINLALAEKIAIMDADALAERKRKAAAVPVWEKHASEVLHKAGREMPRVGDELPDAPAPRSGRTKLLRR